MSATLDIRAPADQTEGTRSQVLRWLKAVGDEVAEHEPLIEIETDKVTVEVAAPASGVLREIVKGEQEEVAPGEVLGRLEAAAGLSETARALVPSTPATQGDTPHAGASVPSEPPPATPRTHQHLSPAVRRLLSERGLDPGVVRGTGEGGRVTIDDVLAHQTASLATARIVPHSPVRKRIAAHMVQSLLHTAPHVTTVFEADLTAVLAHRARHRADFDQRGTPLTLTAYFLSASVAAIRAVPEANSHWTDSALEIFDEIHIGIATALEGSGLVVPVLRNVELLDLFGIAHGLNPLVAAAREGNLEPADVRGGTFTISNHGVSGSLFAAPIVINQPQSAILGIGKLEKRPVATGEGDDERILIRPKCYVTLTIDHRVMDGHQANHFLQVFVRTLEAWPAP